MALKSERIAELSGKLNGFADFENTAVRGSAANFISDQRTLPVKKFASWILRELRIVDFMHFLHYSWDESFFLPKILKMSMSFTFITFTSLKINCYTYVSFSKGIEWKKQTSTLHCNKRIPQYEYT